MGKRLAEWANRDLEMFSLLKAKPNLERKHKHEGDDTEFCAHCDRELQEFRKMRGKF